VAPTPAGAVRRARALANRGWAPEAIERAAGIPADDCRRALENRHVISPDAAQRIAAAYDRLWNRQPPRASENDRQAAEHVQAHARSRGWAPPLAWDDDVIDLPDGRPADGWKRGKGTARRAADLVEDAEFVRETGGYRHAPVGEVAMRLGVTRNVLEKALERTRGREPDLDREAG
jgi:hypothetical protein